MNGALILLLILFGGSTILFILFFSIAWFSEKYSDNEELFRAFVFAGMLMVFSAIGILFLAIIEVI